MKLDKSLNTDMGRQLGVIEKAVTALEEGTVGSISTTGLNVTSPDATDLASAQTLANELKAKHNLLVTRLAAAQQ